MEEHREVTVVPSSIQRNQDAVNLVACPRPFSAQRIACQRPAGGTVADHMRAIGMHPDPLFARVFIDDRLVLKAEWECAIPKAGQFVTVRAIPTGGGGGKDALRIVAMIGLVVASVFTAGGGLGIASGLLSMNAGFTISGALGVQAFAAAAISIAGGLAVSGRIPPPLPRRSLLDGPGRKEAA